MALKIFEAPYNWGIMAAVNENTNCTMVESGKAYGSYGVYTITFPDGNKIENVYIEGYINDTTYYGNKFVVFVDEDNDFFYSTVSGGTKSNTESNGAATGISLAFFANNAQHKMRHDTSDYGNNYFFSLPGHLTRNDTTVDIFEMIPLILWDGAIIPRTYYQTYKKYTPGLKFIDNNGNKWVTLGGYLLYHYE